MVYKAIEFATFHCTTMSLLPTHQPMTNEVICRNRRIGVSITGLAQLETKLPPGDLTKMLNTGYAVVRSVNQRLSREAGVAEAIRVTTVKPEGTIGLMVGTTPGVHFPSFGKAIRGTQVGKENALCKVLIDAGIPYEQSVYSSDAWYFQQVMDYGDCREASEVSVWDQFAILVYMQRMWADNMISQTITFQPASKSDANVDKLIAEAVSKFMTEYDHENQIAHDANKAFDLLDIIEQIRKDTKPTEDPGETLDVERCLARYLPQIKSVSMLPQTPAGVYKQMPFSKYDENDPEMVAKFANVKPLDFSSFTGSDGEKPTFCQGDTCELPAK